MVFFDSLWNYWSGKIVTIVGCIIIGSITITYCYKLCNSLYGQSNHKQEPQSSKKMGVITCLTLFTLLINACFNAILITPKHLCQHLLFLTWLFFGYYKGGLYIIYVSRLDLIYYGTQYQINRCLMRILWAIIIQYFIVFTFEIIYGIYIIKNYEYIENEVYSVCTYHILFWNTIHFAFHDVIFTLFCLGLFIRPLYKLIKRQKAEQEHFDYDNLLRVCIRFTLITFIAVITSIILIITAVFGIYISSPIDKIINSLCIISYDKKYRFVYDKLCKKFETCLICQCCGSNKSKGPDKQIFTKHIEMQKPQIVEMDSSSMRSSTNANSPISVDVVDNDTDNKYGTSDQKQKRTDHLHTLGSLVVGTENLGIKDIDFSIDFDPMTTTTNNVLN